MKKEKIWPIFILTLEGDEIRRKPLCDYLDAHAIKYELFYGVDGRNGLPSEYEKMVDRKKAWRKYYRNLTDGELACGLGHRLIYEKIIKEGIEGAIVLEDDVLPEKNFVDYLFSGIYRHYPMVLLDYRAAHVYRKKLCELPYGEIYRLKTSSASTGGYCLKRETANALIQAHQSGGCRADWPCDIADVGATVIFPRMVQHIQNGASHIQEQRKAVLAEKSFIRFLCSSYYQKKWRLSTCVKKIK